jgi:geranylgeranyl diphosphate synthase type II
MGDTTRIEQALAGAVDAGIHPDCPPRLASALHYAVFPGGARIRPRLCLAVARACGEDFPALTDAAAASIELLHCASLVHDDLPCFDDASTRRGKLSVHRAYGERLAVLSGDALIVMAFQTLAASAVHAPERLAGLLSTVGAAVGAPRGIIAGQAWECEPVITLADYQRAKTGVLFGAATEAGALAAGAPRASWHILGERLGEAYQVADDIRDAAGDPAKLGKPVGRDEALDRPSATRELGIDGAVRRLKDLVEDALESIPTCVGAAELRAHIMTEVGRLLPEELARRAA